MDDWLMGLVWEQGGIKEKNGVRHYFKLSFCVGHVVISPVRGRIRLLVSIIHM